MQIIQSKQLTKKFDDLVAVDQLTLSVARGEIFGLVGPDGAGKTTTMRLLTSIMDPTSGDAWVAGHHTVRDAEQIKKKIGYMSQRFGLYHDLTVIENIEFFADIYDIPKKERGEKIEYLLGFSQLTPFKKRLAQNLSGGMKQKLGLACALIHKPEVLFLDEPTTGVDPVSRRDFWKILYQLLRDKVTIFISTTYMDEAERCNRLAFLHQAKLLAIGTPTEVKAHLLGNVLEVRVDSPRKVIGMLQEELGRDAVCLVGNRIHLITKEIEKTKRLLPQAEIHFVEPSLEGVFVSLLARNKHG